MENLLFIASSIENQTKKAVDKAGTGSAEDVGKVILNSSFAIVGVIGVVMIIIGGVYYATSQGDPQRIAKGKNTIMYGLIGLVIAVLAFAIVNYVISHV